MTEFLQSIKSDLLSRRLLPFVALLGAALIAAVGYAVAGGSSGSASTPLASAPSSPASGATVLPVAVAPANPNEAVSETPGGVRYQSHGPTRDPFIPLPSPPAAKSASGSSSASSKSSSKSSGSSSKGSSSGGTGSSGGGSGTGGKKAPAPTPKKAAKPQFPYDVSVLFGLASTPGQPATLAPYENLKPQQPLPSKQTVRISFERVTAGGNGAVFQLTAPPILHGSGICLPSTSECQTIDLEVGHSEELEYVEVSGQVVVYELKVVSIVKKGASAARVKHTARAARSTGTARAAQAIGDASSLQLWVNAHAALAKPS